jgi:hypothetical protein
MEVIHIGNEIKKVLDASDVSVSEFAENAFGHKAKIENFFLCNGS